MRVLTFVVTCDYIDFWTLCFAHHFVYCCNFTRSLIKFFACLYLTTMQILWARKYEYGVLFITHAREIFKLRVKDEWFEDFSKVPWLHPLLHMLIARRSNIKEMSSCLIILLINLMLSLFIWSDLMTLEYSHIFI